MWCGMHQKEGEIQKAFSAVTAADGLRGHGIIQSISVYMCIICLFGVDCNRDRWIKSKREKESMNVE